MTSLLIQIFNFINPRIVDTTFFHNKFKNLLQKSVANLNLNKLNLKNLRVVHFYSNYGGIYIPNRNRIIKNLIYKLLTRNKNVDKIYLFESSTLPDLIVRLNSKYIFSVKNSFLLKNYSNSFNHSDQGIMIAYGKNIKKDHFSSVSYIDLAPTFLSLYNINQPKDMKGKPLKILK